MVRVCIRVAIVIWRNYRVFYTDLVFGSNQLIVSTIKPLKPMVYGVVSISRNELVVFNTNVFASLFIKGEVVLVNSNGRSARIIYRVCCMLIRRSESGCSYCIREVTLYKVINLSTNVDLSSEIVVVVVINGKFIGLDLFKNCYCIEALRYSCSNRNRSMCCFVLPMIKHFILDKRIIGKCSDLVAHGKINEVLRLLGDYVALIILYKELYRNLSFKVCIQS